MPKAKGKGGQKGKGQKKETKNPMDCEVDELILSMKRAGQSDEVVCLAKHFVKQAEELYPNLARETITVPAIYVNKCRTKFDRGLGYDKLDAPQESDSRGDKAHVVVFQALYDLSQTLIGRGLTPLFIINSYPYDSYLSRLKARWEKGGDGCLRKAASLDDDGGGSSAGEEKEKEKEKAGRDLPVTLPQESGVKRGEVDVLVLQPGRVAFVQAKSMGDNWHEWPEHKLQQKDAQVMSELGQAFKQLDRDDRVFEACMRAFYDDFEVVKIAAFPNLTWRQIREAYDNESSLLTEAGFNLDLDTHKVLCKDDLPGEGDNSQEVPALVAWWLKNVENLPEDYNIEGRESPPMDGRSECDQEVPDELNTLKNVVGRYLGVMSIVTISSRTAAKSYEVRRLGQSVRFVSEEYSRIILTPQQVNIVNDGDVHRGFLSGPPGSGKTVVLAIRARSWIFQDQDHNFVVNINMYRGARGRAIGKQTIKTICSHQDASKRELLKSRCYELCLDVNDFDEEKRRQCVQEIQAAFGIEASQRARVLFLVDETYVQSYWANVFKLLTEDFRESPVWLAGLYGRAPQGFTMMHLTKVIRCHQRVQTLLKEVDWIEDRRKCYLDDYRSTGTFVLAIRHRYHGWPSLHPTQCRECAEDIVSCLDRCNVTKPGTSQSQARDLQAHSLKCRDVCLLINLPRALYRFDKANFLDTSQKLYEAYMESLQDCPLFETLRCQNYPVKLHVQLPCRDLVDDHIGSQPHSGGGGGGGGDGEGGAEDHIKACWVFSFQGLENRMVFYLPGDPPMPDDLDLLPEDQRSLLTDPQKNIPCPGYRTKNTEDFDDLLSSVSSLLPSSKNASGGDHNDEVARRSRSASAAEPMVRRAGASPMAAAVAANSWNVNRRGSLQQRGDTRYRPEDIARYTRWDKSILFISASRCTGQLVLITP